MTILNSVNQFFTKGNNKLLAAIGHSFFFCLFLIAFIYYKERVIPFDGAFYCFKIIHFDKLNVENGRFGAVVSQLLPLLGLKMGCTLETFLKLYSVSFVLISYLIFLVIFYGLKDSFSAVALMLALCLGYRYNFYYPVSEIHQTIAPAVLLFAILNQDYLKFTNAKRIVVLLSALLIIFWLVNIHVLSLFLVLFVIIYQLIISAEKRSNFILPTILLLGVSYYLFVILSIPKDSYQGGKLLTMDAIKQVLTDYKNTESYKFLEVEFPKNYYVITALWIASLVYFLVKRKFISFLFVALYTLGFLVLILATYIGHDSPIVYQNYYALFGVFIGLPFAVGFLKNQNMSVALVLILFALSTSLYKVWKSRLIYTQRIDYLERVTAYGRTFEERKFIVDEANFDWRKMWIDWDISFESLLISSIPSADSAVTFCTLDNTSKYDSLLQNKNLMIGADFAPFWFSSNDLNQKYFKLPNTNYLKLNTSQGDSAFNQLDFNKENVLIVLAEEYKVRKFDYATVPVTIINKTNKKIPSRTKDNPVYMSYHLYDAEGKQIVKDDIRTPFEEDILPNKPATTGLVINLPQQKGEYILEVDIITENKRWWEINKRSKLIIN